MNTKEKELKRLLTEVADILTLLLSDMEIQKADPLHIRMVRTLKDRIGQICVKEGWEPEE